MSKKTISLEKFESAPKVIYMVQINLGGLVHDKVYELRLKYADKKEIEYWDRSGNIWFSFGTSNYNSRLKRKIVTLNEIYKSYGLWQFITDDKEKAKLFHKGAIASLEFMNDTWLKYYNKNTKR